jgi:predicted DNA-binding ribbon-helix-helix protein
MSANTVDALLGRVSESSRCEIENLIDELQTLHNKLQNDRSRIRRDIMEYAGLSQQVMQVTTIISDSVKTLPGAPGISR